MWYVKIIIGRAAISLKHFEVARFQSAECASNGGSLADGFMAFAWGTSLILVGSLWQISHWPKNGKFLQCFSEEPFMRFFVFRFL
jgi:predicted phage tail protein